MEFELSSFLLLLLSLLASIFAIRKLAKTRKNPKPKFPPGPRKLPLIGHLHHLTGPDPPHYKLADLSKRYGPLMYLRLGEIDNIVVSSPEIARAFLKTHDVTFASRPSLLSTEIGCYNNTDIAFAPYGDYWRQLRKICTLELLSAKRVQSFRPIRVEVSSNLCKWIAGQDEGSTVNLSERVSMSNYDVMVRAAIGKKSDEASAFTRVVKEGIRLVNVFHVADLYPSIKIMQMIGGLRTKIENHHRQLDRIIGNVIDERKRENARVATVGDGDGDGEKREDLLDVLLKFQSSGSLDIPLTDDNIKAVLQDMFGAGVDTSPTVIDWAMSEMLRNPRVLKKAQEEVRRVFDNRGGIVDERYFDELKYFKLVIKETLRAHPVVPLLLPRESREPCIINGYEIPVKTRVVVNAWAIGRDPEYWEEPQSFKPERFIETPIEFTGNNFEYIPFGSGRRACPGMMIGLANVELPLAMFLYHFDWMLPDGMKPEDLDMTELAGASARRKFDLCVVPTLRRPLPHQGIGIN
ncbi:hypothetical protein ABFX02_06G197200 [Erythranthe guttata]